MGFLAVGAPLVEGLRGDGKAELDVCLDLAGVGGAVKQPELNGPFLEHAVQVQAMVAAVMVMLITSVVPDIPDAADRFKDPGLFSVELVEEALLNLFAILPLPCYLHLHGLVNQILFGGHDVGDVPQSVGVKRGSVNMIWIWMHVEQ